MKRKGNVLIVGGGKIGRFLVRKLALEGYRTSVLDIDRDKAKKIADEIGIIAYSGDGTDVECLRASGAGDVEFVIAMTGSDEVNLVVCQLAKQAFSVGMTIALVTDPRNEELFSRLEVDETICASSMVVRMIERVLPAHGMRFLSEIGRSSAEIYDFSIEPGSPSVGVTVASLKLPAACVLVAVTRGDDVIFPRGDTLLGSGDHVYGLSKAEELPALRKALLGA